MKIDMKKGFTLIELLVVIAIIAILASVVLINVNGARSRARSAAVKTAVSQFRTLMEQQYDTGNSYRPLWSLNTPNYLVSNERECDLNFANSSYAQEARNICKSIVSNADTDLHPLYIYPFSNNDSQYSILVGLPTGTYYCVGSSGGVSDIQTSNGWSEPGCPNNP